MGDCAKSVSVELPLEILVKICSFYVRSEGYGKLYTFIANVSTAWRKAALLTSFWTERSFSSDDFTDGISWVEDEGILELISAVKTLNFNFIQRFGEPLHIQSWTVEGLGEILQNSYSLERFNLNYCHLMPVPYFLFNLPIFCPKIKEIQTEWMACDNNTSLKVFVVWVEEYNRNLTKLILRHVDLRQPGITRLSRKIAECCPNLTNLELDLLGDTWKYPNGFDLNSVQAGCLKMKELCFRNVRIVYNLESKSGFPDLEKLSFTPVLGGFMQSLIPEVIVHVLKGSKDLKELELTEYTPNAKTMRRLPCDFLRKLTCTHSSDETDDLYDILRHWNHSLTELDVSCNEKSLQCLLRYIKKYGKRHLESLSLLVSGSQMEEIKRILRWCAKLRFLHIMDIDCFSEDIVCFHTQEDIKKWVNS